MALKEMLTVLPALHADAHVHVEVKYTLHAFGYKQQFEKSGDKISGFLATTFFFSKVLLNNINIFFKCFSRN